MTRHRRILGLLALLLFLSLPTQAGTLFVCKMDGAARSECCCKPPQPGQPAAMQGECCCSQTRWDAASASLSPSLHSLPAPIRARLADSALLPPAPTSPGWTAAARLPADPAPPDLYLTSCSLLI